MKSAQLDRYLALATRGLWGKYRASVREELRTHVVEKVHGYQLAGLDAEIALERVLGELGPPRPLGRQFAVVHTLPGLGRLTVAAAVAAALSVAALPTAASQVSLVPVTVGDQIFTFFLDLSGLIAAFQPIVEIRDAERGLELVMGDHMAVLPWTEHNSRIREGKREIALQALLSLFQRAGIGFRQLPALDRITLAFGNELIVLQTSPTFARQWNEQHALAWALGWGWSVDENGWSGTWGIYEHFINSPSLFGKVEGRDLRVAGRVVSVVLVRPGIKPFVASTIGDADGRYEFDLPTGLYEVGIPQKNTPPTRACLYLGLYNEAWPSDGLLAYQSIDLKVDHVIINSKEVVRIY